MMPASPGCLHAHFYAAPGVGKSLLAAAVYTQLKIRGAHVELVREYAQELIWVGQMSPSKQSLVTMEQTRREEDLRGKVDIIVSDSPPLLGVVYAEEGIRSSLRTLVTDRTRDWFAKSYLLSREMAPGSVSRRSRLHGAEDASWIKRDIEALLTKTQTPYLPLELPPDPAEILPLAGAIADNLIRTLQTLSPAPSTITAVEPVAFQP